MSMVKISPLSFHDIFEAHQLLVWALIFPNLPSDESHVRPLFGMSLEEHGKLSKREVALVIQDCVEALRDGCLDTEGLFRIAGSATKVKFLKV